MLMWLAVKQDVYIPMAPIDRALAQIGKQFGFETRVSPAIGNPNVVLYAKDVTAEEVRQKFEETLNATFELKEGTYVLTKSTTQVAKDKSDQQKLVLEEINAEIELRRKSLLEAPELTKDQIKELIQRLDAGKSISVLFGRDLQTPMMRLISRIMIQMDPKELAKTPSKNRVVYSTQPNKNQKQLRIDLAGPFSKYQSEWKLFESEMKKVVELRKNDPKDLRKIRRIYNPESNDARSSLLETRVSKLVVAFQLTEENSSEFNFIFFPQDKSANISEYNQQSWDTKMRGLNIADVASQANPPDLVLSEAAKNLETFYTDEKSKLSKAAIDFIAKVTENEPGSTFNSEVIKYLAEKDKRNMLMVLSDTFLLPWNPREMQTFYDPRYLIESAGFTKVDDRWVLKRDQYDPYKLLDRRILEKLIVKARTRDGLDFADWAQLQTNLDDLENRNPYFNFVREFSEGAEEDRFDTFGMRILGLLSNGDQTRARAEGISVRELPARIQKILVQKLLNESDKYTESEYFVAAAGKGISIEPTEIFPNGIPWNSRLWIETNDSSRLTSSSEYPYSSSPEEIGRELFKQDNTNLYKSGSVEIWPDRKMKLTGRSNLDIVLKIDGVEALRLESFKNRTPNPTPVEIKSLPASVQKQIQIGYEKERREKANKGG